MWEILRILELRRYAKAKQMVDSTPAERLDQLDSWTRDQVFMVQNELFQERKKRLAEQE